MSYEVITVDQLREGDTLTFAYGGTTLYEYVYRVETESTDHRISPGTALILTYGSDGRDRSYVRSLGRQLHRVTQSAERNARFKAGCERIEAESWGLQSRRFMGRTGRAEFEVRWAALHYAWTYYDFSKPPEVYDALGRLEQTLRYWGILDPTERVAAVDPQALEVVEGEPPHHVLFIHIEGHSPDNDYWNDTFPLVCADRV